MIYHCDCCANLNTVTWGGGVRKTWDTAQSRF